MNFDAPRSEEKQLIPERKLEPGEAIMVKVKSPEGLDMGFSIIGARDNDGWPTYLPTFEKMQDDDGQPTAAARARGINSFAATVDLPMEARLEIFRSLYYLPPVLAIDRVMNATELDDLSSYPYSEMDGMPSQLIAITAPPRTGKTTYLATLAMASYGEERARESSVRVLDLDPFSPESLTETVKYLINNGYAAETTLTGIHKAIMDRFKQVQAEGRPRRTSEGITLRQKLKEIRSIYRQERQSHAGSGEDLHKMVWLVDVPGRAVDEAREPDIFDMTVMTMPNLPVAKQGENVTSRDLDNNFQRMNGQIDEVMRNHERQIADMEVALMGETRKQYEQRLLGQVFYLQL